MKYLTFIIRVNTCFSRARSIPAIQIHVNHIIFFSHWKRKNSTKNNGQLHGEELFKHVQILKPVDINSFNCGPTILFWTFPTLQLFHNIFYEPMDLPKRMKSIGKNIWTNVSQRMNFALIAVRELRLSWSSRGTFSTLFVSLIAIKTRSILNRSTIESAAEMTMGFRGFLMCFTITVSLFYTGWFM